MKVTLKATKKSLYHLVSFYLKEHSYKLGDISFFTFRKSNNSFWIDGILDDLTNVHVFYFGRFCPVLDITLKKDNFYKNIIIEFRRMDQVAILVKEEMVKFGNKGEHKELVEQYFSNN